MLAKLGIRPPAGNLCHIQYKLEVVYYMCLADFFTKSSIIFKEGTNNEFY